MNNYRKTNYFKKLLGQYEVCNQNLDNDIGPKTYDILKKICESLDLSIQDDIPLSKQDDIPLSKQDEIWKKICSELNWQFVSV